MYIVLATSIRVIVSYLQRGISWIPMNKRIESKFIQSFLDYVPYTLWEDVIFLIIFHSTEGLLSGIVGAGSLLQGSIVAVVYIMNLF